MTSSSGAMKLSTPVAPSHMDGVSTVSPPGVVFSAALLAASFDVSGLMIVGLKPMLCFWSRRGASDELF